MDSPASAAHRQQNGLLAWLGRLARHLWMDADDTHKAVPAGLSRALAERIARSETRHAGEIRLCVEASLPWQTLWRAGWRAPVAELVRQRALAMFGQLGVWDTERNTGVLVYVLLAEHAIEIVADRGLRGIPAPRWQAVADALAQAFREGRHAEGLLHALDEVEALLDACEGARPADGAPVNELPDSPHLQ